jgi:hypothetical protein
MLRALLIGSLLVVPAKIASACDEDDDTADADDGGEDALAEAETPDVPEALEARIEALEQRVDAMERSCDDDDIEGMIEID